MNWTTNLFIFVLLVTISCQSTEPSPEEPTMPVEPKQISSYLALGDSYTIGESVPATENFPNQLNQRLTDDGFNMAATEIIAQTGWRTDVLQSAINGSTLEDTFSIVSLSIGVNNQYQGRPFSQYETEFEQLLNTAIQYAGGNKDKVFVVSIPDYAYTPFGQNRPNVGMISTEIDQYNAFAKTFTESKGISYYDITPISRRGLDMPELVAGDNLHPSAEMYKDWVDLFYDDVKKKIEE